MVLLVMKQIIGKLTKMKRLKTILLFLIICISCFGQNRTRTNTTNTSKRVIWEYKVVISSDGHFWDSKYQYEFPSQTAMLKEMGNEGWELISVYVEIPSFYEGTRASRDVINFVFKRPKSGK